MISYDSYRLQLFIGDILNRPYFKTVLYEAQ